MPTTRTRRERWGTRLGLAWFVLSTAALVWPIYPWLGNHVHPRVLGLPWSLVWVLLVIAANFGVLVLLFRGRLVDDREVHEIDEPPVSEAPTSDASEVPR